MKKTILHKLAVEYLYLIGWDGKSVDSNLTCDSKRIKLAEFNSLMLTMELKEDVLFTVYLLVNNSRYKEQAETFIELMKSVNKNFKFDISKLEYYADEIQFIFDDDDAEKFKCANACLSLIREFSNLSFLV